MSNGPVVRRNVKESLAPGERPKNCQSPVVLERDAEANALAAQLLVLQQQLDAKERAIQLLLHELRTPLSVITTWAQLLAAEKLDDSTRREGARVIALSSEAQSRLLNSWAP